VLLAEASFGEAGGSELGATPYTQVQYRQAVLPLPRANRSNRILIDPRNFSSQTAVAVLPIDMANILLNVILRKMYSTECSTANRTAGDSTPPFGATMRI